jgi:1-acyl-sn-glycerol-3-phosphate acyltransferase
VTIPAVVIALAVVTPLLPLLLVAAALMDLARPIGRRTFASVRLALFLEAFLITEVLGLAMLAVEGLVTIGSPARRVSWTYAVQRIYTSMHLAAVKALFSIRFVEEDAELAAEGGPVVVMVRHASIIDVLIPAAIVANRHRVGLRYVLKRELLAEPCIDVAGHWLPNCFVARDGEGTERAIAAVRALKQGLDRASGVLIYPEGTRVSASKRRRAIERLRGGDAADLARAEALRHLLPIRPGGALALLEAEPACDVLFIGHHGLEGFSSLRDIWAGDLVGRTIRVKLWREPAASIPEERDAKLAWLDARWQRLDDWIARVAAEAGSSSPSP